MSSQCRKTCKLCVDEDDETVNETTAGKTGPASEDGDADQPVSTGDNPEGGKEDEL
jgi:hypothetical protein